MNTLNKKEWSHDELVKWEKLKQASDIEYNKAANNQLEEWVKGISIHNSVDRIISVVDENDNIVSYSQLTGGECCPDFSCCGNVGWTIEKRKKFYDLHKSGNFEACQEMLFGVLTDMAKESNDKIYLAGQFPDSIMVKH